GIRDRTVTGVQTCALPILMLLRVPAYQRLYGHHDRYVHQLRRYGSGDVEQLAVQAGLRVARRSFANMLLFGIVLAARALERLRRSEERRVGKGGCEAVAAS